MDSFVMPLPLPLDIASLTMGLVNIASVTGDEGPLADSVEQVLQTQPHLTVDRFGSTVVARTEQGRAERVLLVGHLATVSGVDAAAAYVEMGRLFGPGACDMSGGLAVMLKAAALGTYGRDATVVFYDRGTSTGRTGLDRLAEERPDLLQADLAIVMGPTDARVEIGDLDPDLAAPAVAELLALVDQEPARTSGRSAAARLEQLGVPALTFGPGDPGVAGTPDEHVPTAQLAACEHVVRELLRA